jgi:hypothetical protein
VSRYQVRQDDSVPRVKRSKTPPAVIVEATPIPEARVADTASWGRPSPADAAAMRGVPLIGRGIGGGAIRGTQPGQRLR